MHKICLAYYSAPRYKHLGLHREGVLFDAHVTVHELFSSLSCCICYLRQMTTIFITWIFNKAYSWYGWKFSYTSAPLHAFRITYKSRLITFKDFSDTPILHNIKLFPCYRLSPCICQLIPHPELAGEMVNCNI